YYATFATSRVAVIFLQAVMETLLAFLNHFPLFAIMLRFKDPERLPGGLRFEICNPNYFAPQGIARVVQGIKSFWPRSDRYDAPDTRINAQRLIEPQKTTRIRKNRMMTAIKENADSGVFSIDPTFHAKQSFPQRVSYLFMQNLPIPLSAIFFQYLLLWKQLSSHYFSFYVLRCLVSGETIKHIARLQYP
ncbi:4583_t:CDS:2, partial [Acaulospora morrowiae]